MSGYTKNIAVIRGVKEGFSADGGPLSGLVRAEKYGKSLRVEVSLINFAPLSEGRYVAALTDGRESVLVENCLFEGASEVDTAQGFAAGVFYVNGGVFPVASAICGNFHGAAFQLKSFVEGAEGGGAPAAPPPSAAQKGQERQERYEDEAIAEENYYEYAKTDQNREFIREDTEKEEVGRAPDLDEAAPCAVEEEPPRLNGGPLSRGAAFYEKMRAEIEGILNLYPAEEALCRTVENSQWVRISYGDDAYYVFGVIRSGGEPQYICYGVPAKTTDRPPDSMAGLAGFIPSAPESGEQGYWVMYQDAKTGASLKIDFQ